MLMLRLRLCHVCLRAMLDAAAAAALPLICRYAYQATSMPLRFDIFRCFADAAAAAMPAATPPP